MARQLPDRALVQRCDMADYAQVRDLIDAAVRHFGRLDVMVNKVSLND